MIKKLLVLLCFFFFASQVEAVGTVRRFVLVSGANFGGADRDALRYAVSDAEHFIRVLESMGGLEAANQTLLREPTVAEFRQALEDLRVQVAGVEASVGRTEVILYYSGHADEEGLRLGEDLMPYRGLRDAMDTIQADVHITVLDACASGAITRLKGGQRQQAFMVDASSDMKGYAFLTSSSENEAAEESDRIRGSFFTHYLVSGLRGAADTSGDGKVTLGEAYHFAFQNTLERTIQTQGGAQHPNREIKMTGTGDVVMTDIRQTSASLVLAEELNGRLFVRDSRDQLVAELVKTMGSAVELGLEPGVYYIHFEQQQTLLHASLALEKGQRFLLEDGHFESADREATTLRGKPPETKKPQKKPSRSRRYGHSLANKIRIERNVGQWEGGSSEGMGWNFGYWMTEHMSVNVALSGFKFDRAQSDSLTSGVFTQRIGLRIYLPLFFLRSPIRPYGEASFGRYFAKLNDVEVARVNGYHAGGGVDVPLFGSFMVGGHVGYNQWLEEFDTPVDGKTDYSGLEYWVGASLTLF